MSSREVCGKGTTNLRRVQETFAVPSDYRVVEAMNDRAVDKAWRRFGKCILFMGNKGTGRSSLRKADLQLTLQFVTFPYLC